MGRDRPVQVLVIEDDEPLLEVMRDELRDRGYDTLATGSVAAGTDLLRKNEPEVVILDLMLPDGSGLDVLRIIAAEELASEAIVLTGYAAVSTAIEAMKLGAYDYLTKPTRMEELDVLVTKAAEKARLRRENLSLKGQLERLKPIEGMLTQDPAMLVIVEMIERVAPADIPVLVQGETGTGKELVARALHKKSPRAGQAFVALNCSAVSENLLESELFGHERGAFTGAVERKAGLLEVADRGVLFLDEIGDMSAAAQVKLLRALETGEFLRVGGTRPVRTDVRIVSATHRDLRREVREEKYREDLYHRLNGVTITLPPLRERKQDIPLLATHFLDRFSGGKKAFSPRGIEILVSYSWPGNVRELLMVVQRAAILSKGTVVEPKHLLLELWDWKRKGVFKNLTLAEVEHDYIESVLEQHQGNRGKAARTLGIDPKTLYNKLRARGEEGQPGEPGTAED
jgi:two-component system, NtrC family, response regulator AtoC